MKKKILAIVTAALIGTTAFAATASAASGAIDVISREDGSGTRGAFIELFGIEEKQGDESRHDNRRCKYHKQYFRYDDNSCRR